MTRDAVVDAWKAVGYHRAARAEVAELADAHG